MGVPWLLGTCADFIGCSRVIGNTRSRKKVFVLCNLVLVAYVRGLLIQGAGIMHLFNI